MSLFESAFRAAYLGALTLAPTALSPEPRPPSVGLEVGAIVALTIPVALGVLLRRRVAETLEATAAAIAWPITAIALLVVASLHTGAGAPLLGGYYVAAPFVWISLSITAAALAGHYLGSNWKNKRVGAAVAVLALGIFLFRSGHELIASPKAMWTAVLAHDPGNERAFVEVFSGDKIDRTTLATAADSCIAARPTACACLVVRADLRFRLHDGQRAGTDAKTASDAGCALDAASAGVTLRELLVTALTREQDWDGAARVLAGAPDPIGSSRLLVAQALIQQGRGDVDGALALAHQALDARDAAKAQRDANLLIASLLIAKSDRTEARKLLVALARDDPRDSDALYDLALVDDLGGDFNAAREGYLKVLRVSPEYRAARYNLALLTLRQGSIQEARHHASKFAEAWPDDPRGAELARLTGVGGAN